MTDAHCHCRTGADRHFVCEPFGGEAGEGDARFLGVHPWAFLDGASPSDGWLERLRERLAADPSAGVGEIGLDRLKERNIPDAMRAAFRAQLALAAELRRPAVLHGAKCWGEVVKEVEDCSSGRAPAYIFHGFSRSAGLLPRIFALNGFVSVGPAVLNDHAVNYRELVKAIPADRLLAETDRTSPDEAGPGVGEIVAAVARLRGVPADALAAQLDANAAALEGCFRRPA